MAGRVRAGDIEELKARLDIADVIGNYVALKPASAGSLKGLCPFHSEKSPSFNVRSSPGFYHCFGCGVGGDVFKFLQEIESISFSEAVERLAERIGFELKYEDGGPELGIRSRLLAANSAAAEYYQRQLASPEGKTARDFLVGRGFDAESSIKFGVGYAPKGWQNLLDELTAKGFTLDELVTAGLVSKSDRGGYDKFRGRVLWPIRDSNSQVLGFGARKLYQDDEGPKYLNTSETPVYHKAAVLYGLDLARKAITKQREIVVVEGYTDVMACHLAGVETAVATCGTAFGEEHIKIINRLLGQASEEPAKVVFTFDPDAAGEKAALRVYGDSAKFNALTFVATGPDGLDPSDLRQQRGDAAVVQMVKERKPLFEFVIRHRISKFKLADVDARVAAARSAAPVLAQIADPALRAGYSKALAEWVTLDISEVEGLISQAARGSRAEAVAGLRTGPAANMPPAQQGTATNTPQARLERQVLEVLLQHGKAFTAEQLSRIAAAGFSDPQYQQIAASALRLAEHRAAADWANQLASILPDEATPLIRALVMANLPATDEAGLAKYAAGVVRGAMMQALSREKTELLAALRRLDPATQLEATAACQRQLVELEAERRMLM